MILIDWLRFTVVYDIALWKLNAHFTYIIHSPFFITHANKPNRRSSVEECWRVRLVKRRLHSGVASSFWRLGFMRSSLMFRRMVRWMVRLMDGWMDGWMDGYRWTMHAIQ